MEKFKKIQKEVKVFLKENWLLLIFAVVVAFLVFGRYLISDGIKIDTVYFVNDADSNYNWLPVGRFGLVFLKYLLGLGNFNVYYASVLFMLFTIIAEFCWIYFIEKHTKKTNKFLIFCSLFLIFGCPIFTEQMFFMLQYAEVMLGIILTIISAELTFRFVQSGKWRDGILPVALNVLTFGIYQSFVMVYLILIFVTYLLEYSKEQGKDAKQEWKAFWPVFLKYLGIFLISFAVYFVIYKSFLNSDYLVQVWGTEPIFTTVKRILHVGKEMIFGNSLFFDLSFLVMGILLIVLEVFYSRKQNWTSIATNVLATILFLVLPFMMIIVTGENQPIRVQIGLPFAVAAGFLICYERVGDFSNQRICLVSEVIVGVVILVFTGRQFKTSSEIEYGGEVIKRSDILLANEIYHDIDAVVGDVSQYQLVIVGQNKVELPESAKLGSMTGESIFNFLSSVEPYYLSSTQYVECIWKAEGKKSFGNTTKESAEAAVLYVENNEMGIFPENKSIVVLDDLVIVKISEDYYHY